MIPTKNQIIKYEKNELRRRIFNKLYEYEYTVNGKYNDCLKEAKQTYRALISK